MTLMTAASNIPAISSLSEAESLLARIGGAMVALVKLFEEETKLIKAGKLEDAAKLTPEKTELAAQYLHEVETFKANGAFLSENVPALVEDLRRAHSAFRDILALNLRVAATAQSVAEGIVRGAATEANRRAAPGSYSRDGRIAQPVKSRPVVVSRSS